MNRKQTDEVQITGNGNLTFREDCCQLSQMKLESAGSKVATDLQNTDPNFLIFVYR